MSIHFDEAARQFHLTNGRFSYILRICENGCLAHVYLGKALPAGRGYPFLDVLPFPGFSNFDKAWARFEYPQGATGDSRLPAFTLRDAAGSIAQDFKYKGHTVYNGKKSVAGQPSS
jgi:alpha-galactosidase